MAREALRQPGRQLEEPLLADVILLATELVTNSVRHAQLRNGDSIRLSMSIEPDSVRVEVTDPGIGFPPERFGPTYDGSSGWGLFLVARLATRWGIERRPTTVWFEIDRACDRPVRAPELASPGAPAPPSRVV